MGAQIATWYEERVRAVDRATGQLQIARSLAEQAVSAGAGSAVAGLESCLRELSAAIKDGDLLTLKAVALVALRIILLCHSAASSQFVS